MINCPKHGITYDDCCPQCLQEVSQTSLSKQMATLGWRCSVCGRVYSPLQPSCFTDHSFKNNSSLFYGSQREGDDKSLTFGMIEEAMPDEYYIDASGRAVVSAQWLHDFAYSIWNLKDSQ